MISSNSQMHRIVRDLIGKEEKERKVDIGDYKSSEGSSLPHHMRPQYYKKWVTTWKHYLPELETFKQPHERRQVAVKNVYKMMAQDLQDKMDRCDAELKKVINRYDPTDSNPSKVTQKIDRERKNIEIKKIGNTKQRVGLALELTDDFNVGDFKKLSDLVVSLNRQIERFDLKEDVQELRSLQATRNRVVKEYLDLIKEKLLLGGDAYPTLEPHIQALVQDFYNQIVITDNEYNALEQQLKDLPSTPEKIEAKKYKYQVAYRRLTDTQGKTICRGNVDLTNVPFQDRVGFWDGILHEDSAIPFSYYDEESKTTVQIPLNEMIAILYLANTDRDIPLADETLEMNRVSESESLEQIKHKLICGGTEQFYDLLHHIGRAHNEGFLQSVKDFDNGSCEGGTRDRLLKDAVLFNKLMCFSLPEKPYDSLPDTIANYIKAEFKDQKDEGIKTSVARIVRNVHIAGSDDNELDPKDKVSFEKFKKSLMDNPEKFVTYLRVELPDLFSAPVGQGRHVHVRTVHGGGRRWVRRSEAAISTAPALSVLGDDLKKSAIEILDLQLQSLNNRSIDGTPELPTDVMKIGAPVLCKDERQKLLEETIIDHHAKLIRLITDVRGLKRVTEEKIIKGLLAPCYLDYPVVPIEVGINRRILEDEYQTQFDALPSSIRHELKAKNGGIQEIAEHGEFKGFKDIDEKEVQDVLKKQTDQLHQLLKETSIRQREMEILIKIYDDALAVVRKEDKTDKAEDKSTLAFKARVLGPLNKALELDNTPSVTDFNLSTMGRADLTLTAEEREQLRALQTPMDGPPLPIALGEIVPCYEPISHQWALQFIRLAMERNDSGKITPDQYQIERSIELMIEQFEKKPDVISDILYEINAILENYAIYYLNAKDSEIAIIRGYLKRCFDQYKKELLPAASEKKSDPSLSVLDAKDVQPEDKSEQKSDPSLSVLDAKDVQPENKIELDDFLSESFPLNLKLIQEIEIKDPSLPEGKNIATKKIVLDREKIMADSKNLPCVPKDADLWTKLTKLPQIPGASTFSFNETWMDTAYALFKAGETAQQDKVLPKNVEQLARFVIATVFYNIGVVATSRYNVNGIRYICDFYLRQEVEKLEDGDRPPYHPKCEGNAGFQHPMQGLAVHIANLIDTITRRSLKYLFNEGDIAVDAGQGAIKCLDSYSAKCPSMVHLDVDKTGVVSTRIEMTHPCTLRISELCPAQVSIFYQLGSSKNFENITIPDECFEESKESVRLKPDSLRIANRRLQEASIDKRAPNFNCFATSRPNFFMAVDEQNKEEIEKEMKDIATRQAQAPQNPHQTQPKRRYVRRSLATGR